jgi:CheY-like chemotaxis protein
MLSRRPQAPAGEFSAFKNARRLLVIGLIVALAMPVLFGLQAASAAAFLSVAAVGLAVVAAALVTGGIVGFIFGIPRLLQDARPAPAPQSDTAGAAVTAELATDHAAPYAGNTSLEQISDWLTKILVGVGLTQLANVPSGLNDMGTFLAPGLGGFTGANIFAIGIVVFAVLIGFFLSYLWTRLNLASLFVESDARANIAAAEQRGIQRGEKQALEATTTAAAVGREARETRDATGAPGAIHGLWVDDQPENNASEMDSMEKLLGVEFVNKRTTEEGLAELNANPGKYAFVITDMSRPGDRRAGYTLLDEMRAREITTPVVVYSAASSPEYDREARRHGAVGATNSPSSLLELVSQIVGGTTP